MSSSNPSLFDNAASQFVETQDIHDLCSKQVASFIKSSGWVRSEDRVMDFGCGVGSFSFMLQEAIGFKECLGVDSSEKMIASFDERVKQRNLGGVFRSACVFLDRADQLNGEKFDVIVSLKAFHHIPDPAGCVSLLKSYLNPGGRLVIADLKLDAHSPEYHRFVTEPPCCDGFTEEELAGLLRGAGLRPEVGVVNCVHYLECYDQEKARKQTPCRESIVNMETSSLPSLLQIANTVYEK
ncbi:hypothetical protein WA577_003670, partial [Blastocystis sp. JDR]